MKQVKIKLILLMSLMAMPVHSFWGPWFVRMPIMYAAWDAFFCKEHGKKLDRRQAENASRPKLLDRLASKFKSPGYWLKNSLRAEFRNVERAMDMVIVQEPSFEIQQNDTQEVIDKKLRCALWCVPAQMFDGDTHFCVEIGKRVATDVVYEAAGEVLYQTGLTARLNNFYKRFTARIGTPSPIVACMAAGAARGLAKLTIKKTLDSFDRTMPSWQRQDFGFNHLVNMSARFGYDDW